MQHWQGCTYIHIIVQALALAGLQQLTPFVQHQAAPETVCQRLLRLCVTLEVSSLLFIMLFCPSLFLHLQFSAYAAINPEQPQ
jgi:hypothetical protein